MAEQDPNTMVHTHVDENGNVITHCHGGDGHTHAHPHTHTQTKAVINRLARAIGHLESVKRMVEDGRDCAEVLIQLAAVRSALNNTAKIIHRRAESGDRKIHELKSCIPLPHRQRDAPYLRAAKKDARPGVLFVA